MNFPKLSVIIANYNNGHFFQDCYKGLIDQTEINWEAIVIDDASTDDSVAIIKYKIKNDTRFKFFQNENNIGYQRTLSRGIALSKAPIFGRVDPDDALTSEAIEKSIKAHNENPEVGLVHTNYVICNDKLQPQKIIKGGAVNDVMHFYNLDWCITHFATFKKDIYDKIDGIDSFNKRAEDQDLYMKMVEAGPVYYLDFNAYLYRVHAGGASSMQNSKYSFFWHWVAIVKAAERRNVDIENLFYNYFVPVHQYHIVNSKLLLLESSLCHKLKQKLSIIWEKLRH